MSIDLDKLEELAKAAGADEWTPTLGTRIDQAAIWLPDGDCIAHCFGNIGHHPEPIYADDVAEYIAAANPASILALIAEVRALRKDRERYQWLANRVLGADYGDNDAPGNQNGWRIVHDLLGDGDRQPAFMYGSSIDAAIDAARKG